MQLLILKVDRGIQKKGDVIEIRASGTPFGGVEPDVFVLVEALGVPMADYLKYNEAWRNVLDYEVVNQNVTLDGFRLRVFSTTVSIGGLGGITKDNVELFLNKWNAAVFAFAANSVTFDFGVYNALQSEAFWEVPIAGVLFNEISYDQGTGIHRIEINYSAIGNNPTYVERYVVQKGGTIISHDNKILTCDITRASVLNGFKADIKDKVEKVVAKRRYYVTSAIVDYVIAQGGMVTATEAQIATYLKDKLDD